MSNAITNVIAEIEKQLSESINYADFSHKQAAEYELKIISLKETLAALKIMRGIKE